MPNIETEHLIYRVRTIADNVGSVASLADAVGIPVGTLRGQIQGRRDISLSVILAILNTMPEVSAEWLLRGEGEMTRARYSDGAYSLPPAKVDEQDKDAIIASLQQEIEILRARCALLMGK